MARYALTLSDGTVANIIAYDPTDERAKDIPAAILAAGLTLVPLKEDASQMGNVNVEPGDKVTNQGKNPIFAKGGANSTTPVVFAAVASNPILAARSK